MSRPTDIIRYRLYSIQAHSNMYSWVTLIYQLETSEGGPEGKK